LLQGVLIVDLEEELIYKMELLNFCRLMTDIEIVYESLAAFVPEQNKRDEKNAGKKTPSWTKTQPLSRRNQQMLAPAQQQLFVSAQTKTKKRIGS
jgi:hypothetical protein